MVAATANGTAAHGSRASQPKVAENGGLVTVECTLTGVTPLLQNAMPRDVLLNLYFKDRPAKTAEKPEPRDVAAAHVYTLPDGRPCVPPRMLYAAFISAGVFIRLDGKRQVSTKTETALPGLLTLTSAELPLTLPGADDPAPWEVDVQQGKNPNGGEAVCIIRPCFYRWEIRPTLQIDRKVFDLALARSLVEMAGRRMGLGDFRPQRKGTFGQYAITRWEVE